jgi:hypothetical protein
MTPDQSTETTLATPTDDGSGVAPAAFCSLPDGYDRVPAGELILPGDLAVCLDGIRGPIPPDWDGVGKETTEYTRSKSEWCAPPVMFFARKIHSENTEGQASQPGGGKPKL